jgi:PQQ-like domain
MRSILDSRRYQGSGLRAFFLACLLATLFLSRSLSAREAGQAPVTGAVTVTPSSLAMLVDHSANLSVVDSSGSPIRDAQWSIRPSIADLAVDDGEVTVRALREGRAILTATTQYGSATATISILPGTKFLPATVQWSLEPTPGHESLMTVQSAPTENRVVFYSIEWSKTANAIVRALTEGGEELWRAQLEAMASPAALKIQLPPVGETTLNHQRISDHTQILIGDNNTFFAANNPSDPSRYGLPADGKYILLRICGANSGGIYLLERGRFRDRIVKLDPATGKENWEYASPGRLTNSWTVNSGDDLGIVETIPGPPAAGFLILDGETGAAKFRIPFPASSSTLTGIRCSDPIRNVLSNVRPSVSGSPFTNTDGNMYVQVEVHIESVDYKACKPEQYSFDERLMLLRVTPGGEPEWKTFQHIHADGTGGFAVQDRLFAGETIPDGTGGVLAAWTYVDAHTKPHEPMHTEARISRISNEDQRDFTLPMPYWTPGLNSFFDENMVLGDNNILFATNGVVVVRFDTQTGLADWVRRPPTGNLALDHATAGGGVLVFNAGHIGFLNAKGDGLLFPWAAATDDPENIGVAQFDVFDHTPEAPITLRKAYYYRLGDYLGVEAGAPKGRGTLLFFNPQ